MPFKSRKKYAIRSVRVVKTRCYSYLAFDVIIETIKKDKDMRSGFRTITRPMEMFLNDKKWDCFTGY